MDKKQLLDEIEAEIMNNIYELIEINFEAMIVADATQIVREPLERLIEEYENIKKEK